MLYNSVDLKHFLNMNEWFPLNYAIFPNTIVYTKTKCCQKCEKNDAKLWRKIKFLLVFVARFDYIRRSIIQQQKKLNEIDQVTETKEKKSKQKKNNVD